MDGWMDGWIHRQTDRQTDNTYLHIYIYTHIVFLRFTFGPLISEVNLSRLAEALEPEAPGPLRSDGCRALHQEGIGIGLQRAPL